MLKGLTAEEVLEAVMQDSSNEAEADVRASPSNRKKKKLVRIMPDFSSDG